MQDEYYQEMDEHFSSHDLFKTSEEIHQEKRKVLEEELKKQLTSSASLNLNLIEDQLNVGLNMGEDMIIPSQNIKSHKRKALAYHSHASSPSSQQQTNSTSQHQNSNNNNGIGGRKMSVMRRMSTAMMMSPSSSPILDLKKTPPLPISSPIQSAGKHVVMNKKSSTITPSKMTKSQMMEKTGGVGNRRTSLSSSMLDQSLIHQLTINSSGSAKKNNHKKMGRGNRPYQLEKIKEEEMDACFIQSSSRPSSRGSSCSSNDSLDFLRLSPILTPSSSSSALSPIPS